MATHLHGQGLCLHYLYNIQANQSDGLPMTSVALFLVDGVLLLFYFDQMLDAPTFNI